MEFKELKLNARTLAALTKIGYIEPTEVQLKVIPEIVSGKNLIVRSQTGTGKTAAFGIGLVERLAAGNSRKALILTPTRELAVQVCKELRSIGQEHRFRINVVYGGQSINLQIDALRGGTDVLVATPGRLLDLTRRGVVRIAEFDAVVLDEADHMLDMGFRDEVTEILNQLPQQRITLLLSATIDEGILSMASKYVQQAKTIEIGEKEVVSTVKEEYIEATDREKFGKLFDVLKSHKGVKTLIFRETKMGTARLQERLFQRGVRAGLLQGDMSQARRNAVLNDFKTGRVLVVVATNVAARGLHIEDLDLIINYDRATDEDTHLHRVGRTGRMGAMGKVINFVARKETLQERMSEEHPDFAWMKEGAAIYHRPTTRHPPRHHEKRGERKRGKIEGTRYRRPKRWHGNTRKT